MIKFHQSYDIKYCIVGFLSLTLIAGVVYKLKFAKKKDPGLQKPDWKKDVVYLCQFPLVPSVRTISPFAIKLETWLRVSGKPYLNTVIFKYFKFYFRDQIRECVHQEIPPQD